VSGSAGARSRYGEAVLLAVLALWALVPVVLMAIHAAETGDRLTGADGVIGADQMQYLAWVRDAGSHGLASDLFQLTPTAHVFAQPMFLISSALWRIGVPLQLAYWLWKPVAIAVLFIGAAWWTRRLFSRSPAAGLAALALTLFFYTPLAALAAWGHLGSSSGRVQLGVVAGEMFPAGELWGYLPSAISVGLMPVVLLTTERALDDGRFRSALVPGLAALAASWLHPWQGVVLLLILAGLAVWQRGRGWRSLSIPMIAALLPLAYYLGLSIQDAAWKLASANELVPGPPVGVLVIGVVPALLLAAVGLRRPGPDVIERALILWIPACLVTYVLVHAYRTHALESLSLPLAVLAVRGWRRIGAWLAPAAGWMAVVGVTVLALVTVPGMAYAVRTFRDVARSPVQDYYLTPSEARALAWVSRHADAGGVLAPTLLATVIPSQTGRRVWVGHQFWSIDYGVRSPYADALFDGRLTPATARELVRLSGAKLLVSSCEADANLGPMLGTLISSIHRFGCSTVYEVAR
jgi:hypothetical protein